MTGSLQDELDHGLRAGSSSLARLPATERYATQSEGAMTKIMTILIVMSLVTVMGIAQVVKPPYILGKNDVRIKSKNFLVAKKARYGSTYQIYNNRKPGGASITFNKATNEFEIVTGADRDSRSLQLAKQEIRKTEKVLLAITGVSPADKCRLKILIRIIVPGSMDGGHSFESLPSCGAF